MVAMHKLSDAERKGVEAAIAAAEKGTTAEFVAVVAARADRYHVASLAAGIIAALLVTLVLIWFDPWASVPTALAAQCVAFGIIYGVSEVTPLSARLAPRHAREAKARRLAHLLFLDRGLASLPARNGVLLLVALSEHQVEIVADRGIDSLVGSVEWRRIVDSFATSARSSSVATALEIAIRDLGALLAKHFPAGPDRRSHVPDRLIEL
jgi:putative membrane protein